MSDDYSDGDCDHSGGNGRMPTSISAVGPRGEARNKEKQKRKGTKKATSADGTSTSTGRDCEGVGGGKGEKMGPKSSEDRRRTRRRKKRAREKEEDDEERQLESLLFGAGADGGDGGLSLFSRSSEVTKTETAANGYEDEDEEVLVAMNEDETDRAREGVDVLHGQGPSMGIVLDRAGSPVEPLVGSDEEDDKEEEDGDERRASMQRLRGRRAGVLEPAKAEAEAAWVDEDDEAVRVNVSGTDRLRKLRVDPTEETVSGTDFVGRLRTRRSGGGAGGGAGGGGSLSAWAAYRPGEASSPTTPGGGDGGEGDEVDRAMCVTAERLLQDSAPLTLDASSSNNRLPLPPGEIQMVRRRDANRIDPNKAAVQVVQFHPSSSDSGAQSRHLLMTAGFDKTLRFFHVDGEDNPKVHGIYFPDMPIYSASFLGDTGSVICSGRRKFFYVYDAVSGKVEKVPRIYGRKERSLETFVVSPDGSIIAFVGNDGYVVLVSARTRQWIADLKMNGSCRAMAFTPDGRYLLSSGSDCDLYTWDLSSRRCISRIKNDDGTITSSLALSSRHLAVGAESGVVNVYDSDLAGGDWASVRRNDKVEPIKSIMNLHSSIDSVKFNHDGRVLALSTKREKDQMKLFHVPSATVFSNWPTSKTPLSYVWSLDFSPSSEYLAIGNDKGKCLLYRLNHYLQ